MTQKNYIDKKKIEMVKPALTTFLRKQYNAAIEEVENSKEYAKHMQDALSTKEYEDFMDQLHEDLIPSVIDTIDVIIDNLYKGESENDFNFFVRDAVYSSAIGGNLPFYMDWEPYLKFTEDGWKEELETLLERCIEIKIEAIQKRYAKDKMNLRSKDWMPTTIRSEFDAVIAVLELGTIEELKQQIANSIDFKAFITSK